MKTKSTLRKSLSENKKKGTKSYPTFDQALLGLGIKIMSKGDK
jgi:hypothetical protein